MIKKLLILSLTAISITTIINSKNGGGFIIVPKHYTINYDCNKAKYLCENGSDHWCDILHQHCQKK